MKLILAFENIKLVANPNFSSQEHPWVTKGGADPLLSAEENCENMIEPPNELELSRAFTRKMNHLLFMMKVIRKFRMLLARIRERQGSSSTKDTSTVPRGTDEVSSSDDTQDAAEERSKAEVIENVLSRRRNLLQQDENADRGHAHDLVGHEPLLLGIGTGARDAFTHDESTPDIVADSPTAVDFNVYDRAYEEAIKRRIEAKPSRRPTIYLTKFVKETEYFKRMENLTEGTMFSPPVLKSELKEAAQTLKDNVSASRVGASSSTWKSECRDAAQAFKDNLPNTKTGKLVDMVNKLAVTPAESEKKV